MRTRTQFVKILAALCVASCVGGQLLAQSIGINFRGRDNGNTTLAPSDVAGVVSQSNWQNIRGDTTGFDGNTYQLQDSTGQITGVNLVWDANDSWHSDTGIDAASPANNKMMTGIQKANPEPDLAPANNTDRMLFTFNGLLAGSTYDVIVYMGHNGGPPIAIGTVAGTSYYGIQETVFDGDFVQATATAQPGTDNANYMRWNGVTPTVGQIVINVSKLIEDPQVGDGIGVAGIQLIKTGGDWPAASAAAFLTDPQPYTNAVYSTVTMSASMNGYWAGGIGWNQEGSEVQAPALGQSAADGQGIESVLSFLGRVADDGTTITAFIGGEGVTSSGALVTLTNPPAPVFTTNPQDYLGIVGDTVTLTAALNHNYPIGWKKNGVEVSAPAFGNTSYSLTTTAADKDAEIVAFVNDSAFDGFATTDVESAPAVLTLDDPQPEQVIKGIIFGRRYDVGGGVVLSDLINNAAYPNSPNQVDLLTTPIDINPNLDNYGYAIEGVICPTATGMYDFFTSSDDGSYFFLNQNGSAGVPALPDEYTDTALVYRNTWDGDNGGVANDPATANAFRETPALGGPTFNLGDNTYPTTQTPVMLQAGMNYGFKYFYKEGGGGDWGRLGMRMVGDNTAATGNSMGHPILLQPANYGFISSPAGNRANIIQQPADASTTEYVPVTFNVDVETLPTAGAWSALWQLDDGSGGGFVDIPGSGGPSYTDPGRGEGTYQFRARVLSIAGEIFSDAATLTVTVGTPVIVTPPQDFLGVVGQNATFSVVTDSALWPVQWLVNGSEIDPGQTGQTFTFATDASHKDAQIVARVGTSIKVDSAAATLTLDDPQPEELIRGFLRVKRYYNINGTQVFDDLYPAPSFPDSPDEIIYIAGGNMPQTAPNIDNFGSLIEGWVLFETAGSSYWMIRSDDASELFINQTGGTLQSLPALPSDDPGFPTEIFPDAEETACCNAFQEPGALQTSANAVPHSANSVLGFSFTQKEGGGGDFAQITVRDSTDMTPAANLPALSPYNSYTMASPAGHRASIAQQPADVTVEANRSATLTVGVSVTPSTDQFAVQWRRNGAVIPGATGATYVTPLLALGGGGTYDAIVFTLVGEMTTDSATVTVVADNSAPTFVAGTLSGSPTVGILFNEAVDQASAENAQNYRVNGAIPLSAQQFSPPVVLLTLANAPGAGASVNVNGVADLAGNTVNNVTVTAQADTRTSDVLVRTAGTDPAPGEEGAGAFFGEGNYFITGGGADIWDNSDGGHMIYESWTGPFLVKARVDYFQGPQTWSKITLMARETISGGSRNVAVVTTRATTDSEGQTGGQNQLTFQWRDTTDGGSGSIADADRLTPVVLPNWMALVRPSTDSNEFLAYHHRGETPPASLDDWEFMSSHTIPDPILPETLLVGIATTSHMNPAGNLASAVLSNYSVGSPVVTVPDITSITTDGSTVTITWTGGGELYSAPSATGPWTGTGDTDGLYNGPVDPDTETYYQVIIP